VCSRETEFEKRRKDRAKEYKFHSTFLPALGFVFICLPPLRPPSIACCCCCCHNHLPPTLIAASPTFGAPHASLSRAPSGFVSIRTPVCTSPIQMVQSLDCLSEISTRSEKRRKRGAGRGGGMSVGGKRRRGEGPRERKRKKYYGSTRRRRRGRGYTFFPSS
jgi:hypothetical protein